MTGMFQQLKLLKENKDFLIIWLTSIFTLIFERAFIFIIPIFLFDFTKNKQVVGLGSLFEILTILIFGIVAGYIVDSFNSKQILLVSNLILLALLIAGFFIFSYFSTLPIFLIMIVFIVGVGRTNNLARTSIIFNIFEGEHLKSANAMFSFLFTLSIILGPIISTSIYSFSNIKGIFLMGVLTSAVSILLFKKLKKESNIKKPTPFFNGMLQIFSLINKSKNLKGIIIFQVLLMGASAVEASLFYVFIKEIVKLDANFFSIVVVCQGIGQVLGSVFFKTLTRNFSTNNIVFAYTLMMAILEGIYILIFPNYYLILVSSFIVGICFQIIFILSNNAFLEWCSTNNVGRLNGLKNTITSTTSIIFLAIFSFLLGIFSIKTILFAVLLIMALSSFIALRYVKDKKNSTRLAKVA